MPKDGFNQDILTAFADSNDEDIREFPRIVVKRIFYQFLPAFINDYNYTICGAEYDDAKRQYCAYMKSVLHHFSKKNPIDCLITGNFGYASERELATAAVEIGIPFLALHKENLKTPGREEFFEKVYRERRGAFTGTCIFVYNEIEEKLQQRSGVVDPARQRLVGMPRLDACHSWREQNAGRTVTGSVLFFAFTPQTGMPVQRKKWNVTEDRGEVYRSDEYEETQSSIDNLCTQTYQAIKKLAVESSDLEVVVKTKGRLQDLSLTYEMLGVTGEQDLPQNLKVVHAGEVTSLIAASTVVCGFNSTALLEALSMGKPVVFPWFEEAEDPALYPYFLDIREVCSVANSEQEVYDRLAQLGRAGSTVEKVLSDDVLSVLQKWTGNADGGACLRTRNAIYSLIKSK